MKKMTSVLISLVLLFCILCSTAASAAGTVSLSTSSASGQRGDTVSITVNVTSNSGFAFLMVTPSYDSSALTLTETINGSVCGSMTNGKNPNWNGNGQNVTATGTLVTFKFKVNETAAIGNHSVGVTVRQCYDAASENVTVYAGSGTVTVTCSHAWGEWTGTEATCGAAGNLSRSCSKCGATETSTPAATGKHSYGNWTNLSETQHIRVCSVCTNKETANHNWDGGATLKEANCKEGGQVKYTCSTCSATKTESTDKTNDHKYGPWSEVTGTDQHKHTCTVCSKEETAKHSWDAGKTTKEPTCKETGVTTFTCSGCSAKKTQEIPVSTEHKYGPWSEVTGTDQHKHTCTVCSKEETANHSWDNGVITQKPTCKDEGVITYTCSGCRGTKTDPIDITEDHKYGNWEKVSDAQHKHTCSVCSKEELADHAYMTTWSKDKTNHWHECPDCKDKKDVAAHTPGAAATEYNAQTCTTCGYVIKPALGHKHKYADKWTTDENGHWYACSGCEEKGSYADHDFENDCDPDCSVCEYTRDADHVFDDKWATDEKNHWHVCTGCELKQDEAAHVPGAEATATTAQTCTICGYEIAPALGIPETTVSIEEQPNDEPDVPTIGADGEEQKPVIMIAVIAAVVLAAIGFIIVIISKKKKS